MSVRKNYAKNRLRPILMKLGMMLEVDETFTTIWLSTSSEVRVKVTWDLKFQKWRFLNSVSSAIFQAIKKF